MAAPILPIVHQMEQGKKLICRGARTSVVCDLTGLSESRVREIAHTLLGHAPKQGRMPEDTSIYIINRENIIESSVFLGFFKVFSHAGNYETLNRSDAMIDAYDAYHAGITAPLFDIDHCWTLLKKIQNNGIQIKVCSGCKVNYPSPLDNINNCCPFCDS